VLQIYGWRLNLYCILYVHYTIYLLQLGAAHFIMLSAVYYFTVCTYSRGLEGIDFRFFGFSISDNLIWLGKRIIRPKSQSKKSKSTHTRVDYSDGHSKKFKI
jgi:hypothetical protein